MTVTSTLPGLIDRVREKRAVLQASLKASQIVAGEIRKSIRDWVSQTEGVKTGALMRSFKPAFEERGDTLTAGVYSDLIYARIHEVGGTITPKSAKLLAIPLTNTARRVRPRSHPGDLFVWKSPKSGKLFLRSKSSLEYILKESVRIKAKRYLEIAAESSKSKVLPVFKAGIAIMLGNKSA